MYVLVSLVILILTIVFGVFYKKFDNYKRHLKKFPGPPDIFFFGCALDFLGNKDMLKVFSEYHKKYGDVVYARFGPFIHTLIYRDVNLSKLVYLSSTNLSKGIAYEHCEVWLGHGLLTTPEKNWRSQRKMINPAFTTQQLTNFISIFNEQADILVEKIYYLTPENSVDVHPLLNLCALDIISSAAMGVQLKSQQDQNRQYSYSLKEMCRIIAHRNLSAWKSNKYLFIFAKEYWLQRKHLGRINAFVEHIMTVKENYRKENNERPSNTLLDILMDYSEKENRLTKDEIKQEVNTFMFAGHDTVTAAMEFFLYEVARRPDIQNSLIDEQRSIFNGDEREVKPCDIHEMRYLEMTIKETLRMYPPVPVYTRLVTKEFTFDGKIIPKGTNLLHCAYGIHKNPQYFPNPEVFDPTRFENVETSFSFLPFSMGPRNCIGQKFAMFEMKVILSKLIRAFEFAPAVPVHNLNLRGEVVLKSANGTRVKILRRFVRTIP